ncbi:TPA: hypothetical protein RQO57_004439 [Aeromonas dhakensis]|uniref:JAB domain-containing protein n=1 Tax=Aeromonas dhakensis TaxID=196024 RepID=UPI0028923963|nr:hypothetical protein [Aeromonas dhakensis]
MSVFTVEELELISAANAVILEKFKRGMAFTSFSGAYVHPREIIKVVLDVNAAAVICAHNHPSGYIAPSMADINITEQIKTALDTIGVRLLDHFIVGGGKVYSFAGRGILN